MSLQYASRRYVRGSFPCAERSRRSLGQARHRLRQDGRNELEGAEIREFLPLRALRRSPRAGEHRRKPAIGAHHSSFAPERWKDAGMLKNSTAARNSVAQMVSAISHGGILR